MAKELDKLKAEFKKIQPKCKPYSESAGSKLKKSVIDAVNSAWDVETEVREAIQKAVEGGVKGRKLGDFQGDGDFSKSFKAWKKATGAHKAEIKTLTEFCGAAEKLRDDLKGRLDKVEKELKKEKPSGSAKKEIDKFLGTVTDEIESLTGAANVYGTLKFVELFYAFKEDATMQVIVKKVADKSSGANLPKLLEGNQRKKTLKQAEKLFEAAADAFQTAYESAGSDPKEAAKKKKLGIAMMEKLGKLNGELQAAAKKQAKEIGASPEKKDILGVIEEVKEFYEDCQSMKKDVEDEMKKAA